MREDSREKDARTQVTGSYISRWEFSSRRKTIVTTDIIPPLDDLSLALSGTRGDSLFFFILLCRILLCGSPSYGGFMNKNRRIASRLLWHYPAEQSDNVQDVSHR